MNPKEKLLWSIAFPGFGQMLNGKYFKGALFILLEFVINVQSHFNEVIMLSFNGEIEKTFARTEYQWLMFYPCVYFFAMWDAYKDAGGDKEPYAFLPFVSSAYLVTVGLMISSKIKVFGYLLGTVWFPMLCVIPGVVIGILIKNLLRKG
ncbi:hypothetical protein SAMN05444673_6581 [Bacillus sp. OV166]|uniref:hypothetical protein n=1 Tax=Bacillus sp. OV166 TaxID=1882763 RepID=UPI000A2AA3A5|nr:hypothetical protein [Bacillus sp. OV166]SMQ86589.1 hypothetical protein SAMN05444673_6581 [Bacillus sp. OV166]